MGIFRAVGSLILALLLVGTASAERIALLVGNAEYSSAVGELSNPHNDVAAIRQALVRAGFDPANIRTATDASRVELLREVRRFGQRAETLASDDIAFFYYSGHGARRPLGSGMSLIPVDVQTVDNEDFWFETVDLADVIETFVGPRGDRSQAAWVVAVDACRNELRLPQRALGGGAKSFGVAPTTSGMLISFAADEGQTAADRATGSASLSPYAKVLAEQLVRPGLSLSTIFGRVRPGVRNLTGTAQQPVITNRLNNDPVLITAASPGRNTDEGDWNRFAALDSIAGYQTYVALHPNGRYTEIATARIDDLRGGAEPDPAPVPPAMFLSTAPQYKPRDTFRDPLFGGGEGPEMVVIPAGEFLMGTPEDEEGRGDDEGPQVRVTIGNPFAVGKYEVTWDEWVACVADGGCDNSGPESEGGDEGWGRGKRPVINVSWEDAQAYAAWLSSKTEETYRLPTEAEWEYVARAGSTSAYWWGSSIERNNLNCHVSACDDHFGNSSPAGSFLPNAFNAHDTHGNVSEWTEDCYTNDYTSQPKNGAPKLVENCSRRTVRGGNWYETSRFVRSGSRGKLDPLGRLNDVGFRVARDLAN